MKQVSPQLKNQLIQESRSLRFPKWNEPFCVESDASGRAIGTVLSHEGRDGKRRPLEFYSTDLNPAQEKYAAGELEIWGIVPAFRKWRTYLRAANKL